MDANIFTDPAWQSYADGRYRPHSVFYNKNESAAALVMKQSRAGVDAYLNQRAFRLAYEAFKAGRVKAFDIVFTRENGHGKEACER